jgi:hypothetical protein
MRIVIGQVRHNIQVHKEPSASILDIHWEEIDRLEVLNQGLQNDVNSFRQLLFKDEIDKNPAVKGVRTKRGPVSVLGYGLKYIFGTADARDVQRMTAVCNELHSLNPKWYM